MAKLERFGSFDVNEAEQANEGSRTNYGRGEFSKYPYQIYFSENGMADAAGASTEKELINNVAKKRGLKAFAIFKAGKGFHSTTQDEFLVSWYDEEGSSYWAARAKNEPDVMKKKLDSLNESKSVNEDVEENIDLDEFKDFDFDDEDSFLVKIEDSICHIKKGRGGRWNELLIFGIEPYGLGGKGYQSYLTQDDVMEWLGKDYGTVSIIADFDDLESTVDDIRRAISSTR